MSFINFPSGLIKNESFRANLGEPVPYGVPFLDAALGGIYPDDLIIISAKTGGGKTEFVTNVALKAAKNKKKVHLFALEAHRTEIESRIFFKELAAAFFIDKKWDAGEYREYPDYQLWFQGKQNHLLKKYEPEVQQQLIDTLQTLNVFYTDKDFNIEVFEAQMARIGEITDLVILDHLHYFDFDGRDENQEMKRTMKQIKTVVTHYRKPAIMVAHLRKGEKYSEQLLPQIDDIHGSSDIAKIATKIIVTGPATDEPVAEKYLFPTYTRILKNRTAGNRTFYTSLCMFDSRKNEYDSKYFLGEIKDNGKTFERIVNLWDYPQWARSAR